MLYSGKGDAGSTNTFGCDQKKISKSSALPEALGSLDELNSFLGLIKIHQSARGSFSKMIRKVQENLFIVQAELGGANKALTETVLIEMENEINRIEEVIPPLKGFCISGGTELSVLCDISRTFARCAERRVVAVADKKIKMVPPLTLQFLNRLSSLLFALARLANHEAGIAEENPRY